MPSVITRHRDSTWHVRSVNELNDMLWSDELMTSKQCELMKKLQWHIFDLGKKSPNKSSVSGLHHEDNNHDDTRLSVTLPDELNDNDGKNYDKWHRLFIEETDDDVKSEGLGGGESLNVNNREPITSAGEVCEGLQTKCTFMIEWLVEDKDVSEKLTHVSPTRPSITELIRGHKPIVWGNVQVTLSSTDSYCAGGEMC